MLHSKTRPKAAQTSPKYLEKRIIETKHLTSGGVWGGRACERRLKNQHATSVGADDNCFVSVNLFHLLDPDRTGVQRVEEGNRRRGMIHEKLI